LRTQPVFVDGKAIFFSFKSIEKFLDYMNRLHENHTEEPFEIAEIILN
jgi:hypothetical protein